MSFPSVKLYRVEFGVIEGASEMFSEHIKALLKTNFGGDS